MSDVNAIINIDINSTSALTNLKRLESQIDQFNRSIATSNATAAASQQSLNRALLDGINNTGLFTAKITPVESSMTRFSRSLDEGRLSLGEYTRYASSQLPGLSRVFKREFDSIEQVATSRVKSMQTQYLALGKTVDGVTRTIASTPTGLGKGLATDLAMVQQRQQIFNKLLDDGSTKLLNWGKNTQWAGRQLMVGFTLPLAAFGAAASKTFMEIDKATVSLKRVYGDLSTTKEELNSNVQAVKGLGKEYTKYGITLAQTIELSARAAATGATNEQLMAATEQTLRFATLGQMDYNQALDTTISLQTAFAISNEDLGKTVDYLNAVENQTILTMEDMSLAIPRVATVVKGLGGSVQDLAVMMTAMREGGVSAENAANGLKSGLASLINPTDRASEGLAKMGINLNSIIKQNKGDLMGIITEFGTAINKLDEFSRQQVLEQVFGKYQYARMSALFTNITKDAGQAARAMDIAGMSAADLAKVSEKELGQISESTSVKFQAAMEQLKISIAPIGEAFLKGITPIVNMVSKIADAFNNLPDGVKNTIAVVTGLVAGLGPVFLMTIGLLGNGLANLIKGFQFFRKTIAGIKGDASAFNWLAQGELEAVTASKALEGSATTLTDKLLLQRGAVSALTAEYERFAVVAGIAGARMGGMGGGTATRGAGGRPSLPAPRGFATGGIVPGTGNSDTIPALLTPGESVITKKATQKYAPILQQMNDGTLPGFAGGFVPRFLPGRMMWQGKKSNQAFGKMKQMGSSGSYGNPTGISLAEELFSATEKNVHPAGIIYDVAIRAGYSEDTARKAAQDLVGRLINNFGSMGSKEISHKQYDQTVSSIQKEILSKVIRFSPTQNREVNLYEELGILGGWRNEKGRNISIKGSAGRLTYDGTVIPGHLVRAEGGFSKYGPSWNTWQNLYSDANKKPFDIETLKLFQRGHAEEFSVGGVSIGQAIKSWQTSSRSVRENPEMLNALMSEMRPLQSAKTLTRGTTLGLSKGSEFASADEKIIIEALRSGNSNSLIGKEFDMRGPISYTAGNTENAINAMAMNTDVNRIKELKKQHVQAKQTHAAELKRIETLKEKIKNGKGPITTYQRQLEELQGFSSMYAAGQKAKGKEIKKLASKGYEDLLIEQRFNPQDLLIDVNAINPNGTFMGQDVSRESEFISKGSRVRVTKITIDQKTGLTKLILENIVDNVQKRALGGPIVPGTGNGDTVPAMLTPGEFVINKQATQANLPLLHAINDGKTINRNKGGMIDSIQYFAEGGEAQSRRRYSYGGKENISEHVATITDPNLRALKERELEAARRGAAAAEEMAKSLGASAGQLLNIAQIDRAHTIAGIDKADPQSWTPEKWMPQIGAENQLSTILQQSDKTRSIYLDHLKKIGATESEISAITHKVTNNIGLTSGELQVQSRVLQSMLANSQDLAQTSSSFDLYARSTVASAQARGQAIPSATTIIPGQRSFMEQGMISGGITEDSVLIQQEKRQSESRRAIESSRKARLAKETRAVSSRGVAPQAAAIIALKNIRAKDQEDAIAMNEELDALRKQIDSPEIDNSEDPRRRGSRDRRAKMGRGLRAGGGAMMMAGMMAPMLANQEGKVMGMDAGAISGGLMGAGMLSELAPMLMKLPPQVAIAGAAIAAVGAGFVIWRKSVDDASKKTAELGANMGGTSNALNTMAQILGQQTPNQRITQMQLGFTPEQQQVASQFQPMLESETGQKFIKDLESATSAERFKKLSDYLKNAIASGMMDTKTANVFAKTIATTLSDPVLGQSIIKSISGQKTGGAAMLSLAQARESGVIAGGQLKVLGANKTVEETTASSVIGSSIQLIQDFSNASALAKEELIAGNISYSKYKKIIDQSTAAQEKYTQAIEASLIKTEDMGATMQAWKDQLMLSGFSEDVIAKVEESTKVMSVGGTAQLARGNLGPANGENAKNYNKLLGQEKARKNLNITSEMLQASATNALMSGMSPAQVVAITNEIKKGGAAAQTFSRTKDMSMAAIAMNVENGAIPELVVSDELKARGKATNDYRTGLPSSNEAGNAFRAGTLRAQQEIQRRERGQQAYTSGAEKFKKAGFGATDFQQVMSMVGSPNVIDLSFQLSGMSDTEIKDTVIQTQKLNELIGPEGSQKIMDIIVNENPPNINKRLPEIIASIEDIMKIPDDVQKKLGIDTTNVGDVDKWGPMADELTNLSTILDTMPEGVRSIGIDLMLDANGKPLSPEAYGKASRLITKAYKDLASGNSQVKKKAIITLIQETKGMLGKTLSLEESQKAYQDLIDTYGKGKITKLPPDSIIKVINLRVDIEGLDKAIGDLDKLIAAGAAGNEERRAREKLAQLKGAALTSEATAVQEGLGLAQEGSKTGGGGGGGGTNPLLDLKKSILEQIKMYVDINATMKKLNDQKYKFADIIMGGQGVFDKLKSIKGIAGGFGANGLGSAAREAIMGMGPDAAKKWIEKNTTKNKKGQTVLTKKGQQEANRLEALSIKGTMIENVNAFESSRAQKRAAVNLKRKGVSDNVVQSIAGDPEKAKQLDFLQQQINNKVRGSKKLYWEFVNEEKAAIEQAELVARAQDPIQTQIDDMTLAHRETTAEIDKQINVYQDQVDAINKEIDALQKINSADQNRIRNLDRQKEMINRDIEALNRKNELDQRSADALKREDEIRNRIGDALSHELDLMSQQETKIRDAYDKRIKALDEVAKINDYIIGQQKNQLGLAQALSQGDVYAAAAAQQEMQAGTAQFAQNQMRAGLQTGMENQIAGLTTAGGLTKDQAEAQISAIKEQSYQTSLKIRDIEDAIYQRNLEIIPLKDSQLVIDGQIQVIQDAMFARESTIIGIQEGKLASAQSLLDKQIEIKAQLDKNFQREVDDLALKNDLRKMSDAQANSVNALAMEYGQVASQLERINTIANQKLESYGSAPTKNITETSADFEARLKEWRKNVADVETERVASSKAAVSNTPVKGLATGGIIGTGGRDSIPAMLTPGEFVMRKASVEKYGASMFEKMNMGAFEMPRYNMQQPSITAIQPVSNNSNINAPVYNSYSVNVHANTNANADDIANTIMTKIKRVDSMAVRSFRGY